MNRARVFALATLTLFALSWTSAQAGVVIGVGVGGPYYHRYYRPYYYGPRVVVAAPVYVGPAPVYVVPPPPPVYVTPAPMAVPAPLVQPSYAPPAQPAAPSSNLPPAPVPVGN